MEAVRIVNAHEFVDELFRMARQFPGQPVAIVSNGETLEVGVMSLTELDQDDWMYKPVPVEKLNVETPSASE